MVRNYSRTLLMKGILQASVNFVPYGFRRKIKHVPGLAALQRLLVNRFLSEDSFIHTINAGPATGLRFDVTLPLDKAFWSGTYEHDFVAALCDRVRPNNVCYDIGGYRGYVSGAMALSGASKVIVFEPLPTNQGALQRLCYLNPDLPIEVVPAAIGNINGSTRLKQMADTSMAKLADSSFQHELASLAELEVAIRRIDSLVEDRNIPPPDIVKIDVEGAELEVLKGATNVFETSRPLIFLEAHSAALEQDCSQKLMRLGYNVSRLDNDLVSTEQTRHLVCLPE